MPLKIKNYFLIIILILLQSCSGNRIGNFLESSFKNIEEPKIKDENIKKLKNKVVINSSEKAGKKINIKEPKIKEEIENDFKKKILINSEKSLKKDKKNMRKNISIKSKKFQPQSYRLIFILKDVDPKDPIEDLSTILRNSDVNFEIEKIERFFDSKGKSIKE